MELWVDHKKKPTIASRNRLAEHYFPLVMKIASLLESRLPASILLGDLVTAGSFGLLDAIERFDPERGIKFNTFGSQRIRGAILDELRECDPVPRLVRTKEKALNGARQQAENDLGRPATSFDMAEHLGISLKEFLDFEREATAHTTVSMMGFSSKHDEENGIKWSDYFPDRRNLEDTFETHDAVGSVFARLSEKDAEILRLYYLEGLTMWETGETLNLSESRVCQLHTRILQKLHRQTGVADGILGSMGIAEPGPIEGAFCIECGKPRMLDGGSACRACRGGDLEKRLAYEREQRLLKQVDQALLEYAKKDPVGFKRDVTLGETAAGIERRNALYANPRHYTHTQVNKETSPDGSTVVIDEGTKKVRKILDAQYAEAVAEVEAGRPTTRKCRLATCTVEFEPTKFRRFFCSFECSKNSTRQKTMRGSKLEKRLEAAASANGADPEDVPGVREPVECDADREDRLDVPGGTQGGVEASPEDSAEPGERPEAPDELSSVISPQPEEEDPPMATETAPRATKITDEQVQYAHEQNHAPHLRSHLEIAKELGFSQGQLSKRLKVYRAANGLEAPNLSAIRRTKTPKGAGERAMLTGEESGKGQNTDAKKERRAKQKVRCHRCKTSVPKTTLRYVDGVGLCQPCREADREKTKKKPAAKKIEKKMPATTALARVSKEPAYLAVPMNVAEAIGAAELARGDLDGHQGACPKCTGKQSLDEMCLLGRAFAARWARLEIAAAG